MAGVVKRDHTPSLFWKEQNRILAKGGKRIVISPLYKCRERRSNDMSPILITGATGNVGTHLTQQLAAKGYPLRALVRSSEKAAGLPEEVERVTGDLARPATLSAAVDGVDRVF